MEKINLVRPDIIHTAMVVDYLKEHADNFEFEIHGGALIEKMDYEAWLKQLLNNSNSLTVNKEWVVSSTFFAIREDDNKLVGIIDIRHELNNFLRMYGGHIGCGIRPSERRKGYATQMMKMALDYCRKIGLDKVMVACYKDNEASRNMIIRCGGVLEKEFLLSEIGEEEIARLISNENNEITKNTVQIFWITL